MAALRDRDVAELYDLLAAYLVLYSGSGTKISKHTLRSYKTGIACLLSHWKGESLVRPGPTAASIYVRTLETEGLSAGTVTVRLAAARALYKALRWACNISGEKETVGDPFVDAKPARDLTPATEKRHPYPESDIDRLLAVAGPEDKVLVLLGCRAGLRNAE